MRIYLIGTKGLPAGSVVGGGGVERHVEEIATRLVGRGHTVFVYVRAHSADPKTRMYKGIHLIRLPSIHTKNLDTITHVFLATMHVMFCRADIVHYHGIGPGTLSWIPRLFKWRAKTLVTFHSRDRMDPKWSWFAKLYLSFAEWAALYFPHETIVVSHVLHVFCRQFYGKETTYIPNGAEIPGPHGTDELKKFGLEPNRYLLGVGRLVPNKCYDVLAEAYAEVQSDMPIVIAGDAEFATEYVEKMHKLAAGDTRIHLVGYQTGEALAQLYAHCYAFVHPSRAEGLSAAVLEAMANGKTVIMTDIKENLELLDHSAVVFPVDNKKALRDVLTWVLKDPTLLRVRGERAREFVRQRYSWNAVVDRLEERYRALLK